MVKNTTGGTGAKSLARKNETSKDNGKLRLPECELEIFGIVTKMLGNGMCEIYTNESVRLIGHIRNSFRGKNKRNNLITKDSIVLVGLFEWEKTPKNCNIMSLYTSNQVEQIKNIPNIKIDVLLNMQIQATTFQSKNTKTVDIDFVEDEPEIIPQRLPKENLEFIVEDSEEIDINDI